MERRSRPDSLRSTLPALQRINLRTGLAMSADDGSTATTPPDYFFALLVLYGASLGSQKASGSATGRSRENAGARLRSLSFNFVAILRSSDHRSTRVVVLDVEAPGKSIEPSGFALALGGALTVVSLVMFTIGFLRRLLRGKRLLRYAPPCGPGTTATSQNFARAVCAILSRCASRPVGNRKSRHRNLSLFIGAFGLSGDACKRRSLFVYGAFPVQYDCRANRFQVLN